MPVNFNQGKFDQAIREGFTAGFHAVGQGFISWTLNDFSQARGVTSNQRGYYAGKVEDALSTLNPFTGKINIQAFRDVVVEMALKFTPSANREIMAHRDFLESQRLAPPRQIEPIPPFRGPLQFKGIATDEEIEAAEPAELTIYRYYRCQHERP